MLSKSESWYPGEHVHAVLTHKVPTLHRLESDAQSVPTVADSTLINHIATIITIRIDILVPGQRL